MILNSPYVTGSLTVTGNITASGGITISGSIASASFATTSSYSVSSSYSLSSSYALSGSYSLTATTASNSLTASSADNFVVRQNVTASNMLATGRITAQTLVVQTVTSSIVYSSGSNIFGNQLTDVQQFTGSLRVTGSTTLNGNAAIGLNPSSATIRTLEINSSGNSLASNTTSQILLTGNAYYGSGGWTYGSTAAASYYQQNLGAHSWFIAPSGTAGAATNFTQSMTLDSSGKLGIGTTTPSAPLEICTNNASSGLLMNGVASTSQTFLTFNDIGCNGHCAVVTFTDNNGANKLGGLTINTYRRDTQTAAAYTANSIVANGGSMNSVASIMEFYANTYCDCFVTLTPGLSASSKAFRFSSQNCNLMTILVGGSVGIGTCSPTGIIDAGCSVYAGTTIFRRKSQSVDAGWTALRLVSEKTTAAGSGFGTAISFLMSDSVNTECSLADLVVERDGSNFCGAYSFRTYAGGASACERMRITSGGCVGIGTPSPNGLLHIQQCRGGEVGFRITNSQGAAGDTSATVAINMTLQNGSGGSSGVIQLIAGKESDHQTAANVDDYFAITTTSNDATTERMRILSGGDVLIARTGSLATTTSTSRFVVLGAANVGSGVGNTSFPAKDDGGLGVYVGSGGTAFQVWDDNQFSAARFKVERDGTMFAPYIGSGAGTYALKWTTSTGKFTYDTSSERYKNNIRDSIYGLCHVMRLNSKMFEYKDSNRTDVGLIAEEVYPVIPELVILDDNCLPNAVSYDRFISVLVKAVQELKCENDIFKTCLGIG